LWVIKNLLKFETAIIHHGHSLIRRHGRREENTANKLYTPTADATGSGQDYGHRRY
jgi:hypothetical protein